MGSKLYKNIFQRGKCFAVELSRNKKASNYLYVGSFKNLENAVYSLSLVNLYYDLSKDIKATKIFINYFIEKYDLKSSKIPIQTCSPDTVLNFSKFNGKIVATIIKDYNNFFPILLSNENFLPPSCDTIKMFLTIKRDLIMQKIEHMSGIQINIFDNPIMLLEKHTDSIVTSISKKVDDIKDLITPEEIKTESILIESNKPEEINSESVKELTTINNSLLNSLDSIFVNTPIEFLKSEENNSESVNHDLLIKIESFLKNSDQLKINEDLKKLIIDKYILLKTNHEHFKKNQEKINLSFEKFFLDSNHNSENITKKINKYLSSYIFLKEDYLLFKEFIKKEITEIDDGVIEFRKDYKKTITKINDGYIEFIKDYRGTITKINDEFIKFEKNYKETITKNNDEFIEFKKYSEKIEKILRSSILELKKDSEQKNIELSNLKKELLQKDSEFKKEIIELKTNSEQFNNQLLELKQTVITQEKIISDLLMIKEIKKPIKKQSKIKRIFQFVFMIKEKV